MWRDPACTYSKQTALRWRQKWVSQTNQQRLWGTERLSVMWCEQTEPSLATDRKLASRGGSSKADALVFSHAARMQPADGPSYQAPTSRTSRRCLRITGTDFSCCASCRRPQSLEFSIWIEKSWRKPILESIIAINTLLGDVDAGFEHFQLCYTCRLFLPACERLLLAIMGYAVKVSVNI